MGIRENDEKVHRDRYELNCKRVVFLGGASNSLDPIEGYRYLSLLLLPPVPRFIRPYNAHNLYVAPPVDRQN